MERKRMGNPEKEEGVDFSEKADESPFDVWGTDTEEDQAARRRDPLRRPGTPVPAPGMDDEEL